MTEPVQVITDEVFLTLKHPLQPRRFALALFFALILFPIIAVALVAGTVVLIVPLVAFLLWLSGRVLFAHFIGNSILVSELNYPRIHRIAEDLKTLIGYKKPVNVFVYEQGNFNAYLTKFFFYRRAVFLNSELLETGVTDDEVRWLVGRFIGYLRARQQAGFWGWTIRAAQRLLVFNLFLLPYERALVYTGDRIALAVINGDISCAIAAMQKLFVGRQLGYSVNPAGILDQHRLVKGSIFALLARLGIGFPHMTARYVDLIGFAKEVYPVDFERFEAENPGLPADLRQLTALPDVVCVHHAGKDPVWVSLGGAVAVLAASTFVIVKLVALSNSISTSLTETPGLRGADANGSAPAATSRLAPATAQQPEPYMSTVGRFSIAFPGAPARDSRPVPLPGGESTLLYRFQLSGEASSYVVMYNDYPARYITADPQELLEAVRDGSVPSGKARLVSDEVIDSNGVPGRAFRFTDKEGNVYVARNFLSGVRLYQLFVVIAPGSSSDAEAEAFLDSFRVF